MSSIKWRLLTPIVVGLKSIDKQQAKMLENASAAQAVETAVNDLATRSEHIGSIVESITQQRPVLCHYLEYVFGR